MEEQRRTFPAPFGTPESMQETGSKEFEKAGGLPNTAYTISAISFRLEVLFAVQACLRFLHY
jgi:hypothetical protein